MRRHAKPSTAADVIASLGRTPAAGAGEGRKGATARGGAAP